MLDLMSYFGTYRYIYQLVFPIHLILQGIESLSDVQIEDALQNLARKFRQSCDLVLRDMESPEYAKQMDKERKNQTSINKQNKEEFFNIKPVDPTTALPKFYEHPETKQFIDKMISMAADEEEKGEKITGKFISEMSNFVLMFISLKSCMRIEVPGNMTPNDFYQAMESEQCFFPFRQATEEEIKDPKLQDELEHTGGYRFDRYKFHFKPF